MDSIELLLDAGTEQLILDDWEALRLAELPSRGVHRSPHNRPHITLLAAPVITADQDGAVGAGLELPQPISCAGIVLFDAGRKGYVLARQVVVSEGLLELHHRVHRMVRADRATETSEPGRWIPHITLANAVPADRLAEALAVLGPAEIQGTVSGVRRWDSRSKTITHLTGGSLQGS